METTAPYRSKKIGKSTFDFYKTVSHADQITPKVMVYRSSPSMTKYGRKLIGAYVLNDRMENPVDDYIDQFLAKMEKSEEARKARRQASIARRPKGKVYLNDKWIAVYNGIRGVGSRKIDVKGFRSTSDTEVVFHASDYGRQIPMDLRELDFITVRNDSDSMTDYHDTDSMIVIKDRNPKLAQELRDTFISPTSI